MVEVEEMVRRGGIALVGLSFLLSFKQEEECAYFFLVNFGVGQGRERR